MILTTMAIITSVTTYNGSGEGGQQLEIARRYYYYYYSLNEWIGGLRRREK